MFSKLTWPFAVHGTLVFLTTKYHDILMFVWGRGRLSQGKGGAKRKVLVKRESLPTDTSGGVIPSRPSRTCTYLYRLRQGGSYTKWPLMSYLNKRILFYGLNVDCLLVDLTLFKFGCDFPKYLFLFEALQLNDNRLYDTPVNLQSCNLADVPNLFDVSTVRNNLYGLNGGAHNIFKAANCRQFG